MGAIVGFLSNLERVASEIPDREMRVEALRAVYDARKYLGDRGALVKVLLEAMAMGIPASLKI
jgi:hypothetical protein